MTAEPLIRNVSDTARWVAVYRARESDREDAVLHDPFARALAGERGERIANALPWGEENAWSWTSRTYLIDRFVSAQIAAGVDLVVNLAAGLDARPYRMDLPSSLKWIEVDLPEILDYKEQLLATEAPTCRLERIALDLADAGARHELFEQIGRKAGKALIITEGLLVYLDPADVDALATDLANVPAFQSWVIDLASPGLLRRLKQTL